ncbi:iron complex transport system substrate-binding protein [Evansella vedderi]|uniref:Iron complex transport system substrate-binding protein n=1 Tax=Evansella vedderi TaxID=38282 RepID=A0ABT9ZYM8_9BACI|nr:ABC transporter substrate-binding protein [Evansella vedderi]MDQ0256350.1 iron complex transport system substrate-binding protein [Evansella vedderi]
MTKKILKNWGLASIILLLMVVFLTACGTPNEEEQANAQENESESVEEEQTEETDDQSEGQFPVTFVDDAGKEITIEEEPERIVSIQASITEISFALGLGDKMVGVSDFCNFPEEALSVENVGGQDMNVELILSLLPDIVFVTDYHHNNHGEILSEFEEVGMKVVVIGSKSNFEEVYDSIALIGTATGASSEAEEIISDMKERHEIVKEKAEAVTDKKSVWVEVSPAPDIFTTGQGTFMHEMLESIQAVNAAEDHEGWVMLTEEEIVQLQPDVIITTYHSEDLQGEVSSRDGWTEVPAVINEQIFDVESDTVVRPGPRLIEGVETLAKLIYPEIFQ